MKTTIFLSVLMTMIVSGCNSSSNKSDQTSSAGTVSTQTFNVDTTKMKSGETYYQCEMHHEIISDKPGNCPKCGMELIEIKKN